MHSHSHEDYYQAPANLVEIVRGVVETTPPLTPTEIERRSAQTLERTLAELTHVSAERDRLQTGYDLAQEEIARLKGVITLQGNEIRKLRGKPITEGQCRICGAIYPNVREADACHVRHGERTNG